MPSRSGSDRCVLLADQHQSLVEGIRGLLSSLFSAIVTVADRASLESATEALHPQVVVLDLSLARGAGLGLIRSLAELCPAAKLIVLCTACEPSVVRALLEAGAHGVVSKTKIATDLLEAVEAVLDGRTYSPQAREAAVDKGEAS